MPTMYSFKPQSTASNYVGNPNIITSPVIEGKPWLVPQAGGLGSEYGLDWNQAKNQKFGDIFQHGKGYSLIGDWSNYDKWREDVSKAQSNQALYDLSNMTYDQLQEYKSTGKIPEGMARKARLAPEIFVNPFNANDMTIYSGGAFHKINPNGTFGVSPQYANAPAPSTAPAPTSTVSATNPVATNQVNPITPITSPTSYATGNNTASGMINPSTAMSGTQTSTALPQSGTAQTSGNVFENPVSGMTKKRKSANNYFNQQWFGKKALA